MSINSGTHIHFLLLSPLIYGNVSLVVFPFLHIHDNASLIVLPLHDTSLGTNSTCRTQIGKSKNHLKPNDGQSTSISNQQQLIVVWTNIHNAQQEGSSSINVKREKNSLEKNELSKSLHEIIESNDDDTIDSIIVKRNQNLQGPEYSIVTDQSQLVFKRDVILILKS
jgi:hypothetical protein